MYSNINKYTLEKKNEGEAMWPVKQLDKVLRIEAEQAEERMLRLLDHDKSLKEKVVMSAYLDGDINLGKAAELLNEHPVVLRQRWQKRGIPLRLGAASVEEVLAEWEAAHSMHVESHS